MRWQQGALGVVLIAALMITSVVALPLLGGGVTPFADGTADGEETPDDETVLTDVDAQQDGDDDGSDGADDQSTPETTSQGNVEVLALESPIGLDDTDAEADADTAETDAAATQDDPDVPDAVEAGVEEGVELAQSQGVEVTQEQHAAALEAASAAASQHQEADAEQVQEATKGAVHGSMMQEQEVNATQVQYAVGGATDGALAQHQTVTATQMQSATWGATHGALAQEQRVTVEQIQVATYGAAAGAASEAGERDIERTPKIQEAAQGAAYGVLEQYQKITVEQRQQVTLEHVQHAAAGASAGALEGSTEAALEQAQDVEVEQHQRVDIKQIQKAATGAAKGALEQRQEVNVEQTQSAARGASKGSLTQVQSVTVEQVQRISITQIQEAAFGASKGSISQSQAASVEQIQAAADGAAQGSLTQYQEVSVTQIQHAALGSSKGAVESAIQHQVIEIEQIQAAAYGAGQGAVTQTQVVDVTQVQTLAHGASSGALVQHQEATVTQIQTAAQTACEETARAIQYQQISITQLQILTQDTAADATAYAVSEDTDDVTQIVQHVQIEITQTIEEIDELEGTASITFADQESDGESVVVDSVDLSEGGFVAIYDGVATDVDPEAVIGVSDYLESGEHENLEIGLDESLEESQPLVAVVHHDTTDDQTFQYVESDGADDEPYVTASGGPVLDGAFVTVGDEEPDPDPEPDPEATLSVSDQTGDGETLLVDEANASEDYTVAAEYDGERVDSETFDADEPVTGLEIDLEPALEDETTVDVSVRASDDDETLASETITYTLEDADDPDDPGETDAVLDVTDQTGDGQTLTVQETNASVEYMLTATANETELVETEPFAPDTGLNNETVDLEQPLTDNATVDVALESTDEGETLAADSLEYTVDPTFMVEFTDCTRAEVTGNFEDGEQVAASTGFYDTAGYGNTIIEDFITVGDDIEAPFIGTIVFDIDADDGVTETGEDEVTVGVNDYGDFGTAITGISSDEAIPVAGIDHPHPDSETCLEEIRPEQPDIGVEETEPLEDDDGIDVTFGYDNPNDQPLAVISEYVEGTTEDEPVGGLEPGEHEFTALWTPETDDERLVWEVDMTNHGYDEPLTAETEPAGEIDTDDPANYSVSITETNSPVEQGDALEVDADIENIGDEAGEQNVTLSLAELDLEVDSQTVELEGDETESVTLTADTDEIEPDEYTAVVASEDDSDEVPVTVEEAGEVAEFAVSFVFADPVASVGEEVTVEADITNVGDLEGTQTVTYSVDDDLVDEMELDLEGGETETLEFTSEAEEGESVHEIATEDDAGTATVQGLADPDVPGVDDADETDETTEADADETTETDETEPVTGDEDETGETDTDESDETTELDETDETGDPDESSETDNTDGEPGDTDNSPDADEPTGDESTEPAETNEPTAALT